MGEFFKSAFDYLSSINSAASASGVAWPPRPPSDPFVGQTVRIESYDIYVSAVIAQGGFGIVFAGYDEKTNKPVALKRLITERSHESYAEAKQEINILKQLNANGGHPNILRLLVYGCMKSQELGLAANRDVFLIATERCYGGVIDLLNAPGVNRQNPLPLGDVINIFYQTCQAVKHMHSQQPPLIHRDLKIENLLFSAERTIRLCDFGSSTVDTYDVNPDWSGNQRRLMETEMQRHTTPRYRSPEILDPYLNYPVNEMLDIWALGVVLFTLCYVIPPFEDEAKLQILNGKYVIPPNDVRFKNCQPLIKKLLQLDPRMRPSIRVVLEDIAAIAETEHLTDISGGIKTRLAALDEAPPTTGLHTARSAPNMRQSPTLLDNTKQPTLKTPQVQDQQQQQQSQASAQAAALQQQAGAILGSVKSGAGLLFKNIKGQVMQHVSEIRTAAGPAADSSSFAPRSSTSDYQQYDENDDHHNAPPLQPRLHGDVSSRAHRPHSETRRGNPPPPRPEPPRELRGTLPVPPYGGDASLNSVSKAPPPPRPPKPTSDGVHFSHQQADSDSNKTAPPRPPKPDGFSQQAPQPTTAAARRVPAAPSLDADSSDDVDSDSSDDEVKNRQHRQHDVVDAGGYENSRSRTVPVENLLPDFGADNQIDSEQKPTYAVDTPKSPDADLLSLDTATSLFVSDGLPLGNSSPQQPLADTSRIIPTDNYMIDAAAVQPKSSFSNVDLFGSSAKPANETVKEANLLGDFDNNTEWTANVAAAPVPSPHQLQKGSFTTNDQNILLDTTDSNTTQGDKTPPKTEADTSNLIGDFSDMNLDAVYNSGVRHPTSSTSATFGNMYNDSSTTSPIFAASGGEGSKSSAADLLGDLQSPQLTQLPPTLFAQKQPQKPMAAANPRDPLAPFINLDFSPGAASSSVSSNKQPMNAAVGSRIGSGPPSATITPTSSTTNFNQQKASGSMMGGSAKSPVNVAATADNFDDLLGFTIPGPPKTVTSDAQQQSRSPTIRAGISQQQQQQQPTAANNFGANFMTRPASNSKLSGADSTPAATSSSSSGMFDDLLGNHKFSANRSGAGQSMGERRRDQQIKEGVLTAEELKVRDWTQGKEHNIRALLSTLHTVLWPEEARWKPVGMHELVDDERIRRVYLRACIVVHPDKMHGAPQEALAKAIFVELNRAWDDFNKQQPAR